MNSKRVIILGASDNPERYSYKAFKMLQEYGHEPILVSPRLDSIDGHPVYKDVKSLSDIDTVTIYVNPKISTGLKEDLIILKPKRFIFNPGTENLELMEELEREGFQVEPACTLILLSAEQF